MLTEKQIEFLKELIQRVCDAGYGWIVIGVKKGRVRYIVPAPSLDFGDEDQDQLPLRIS